MSKLLQAFGVVALTFILSACSPASETGIKQEVKVSDEISLEIDQDASISCESDVVYLGLKAANKGTVAIGNESIQAAGLSIVLLNENGRGKAGSNSIFTQTGGIEVGATGEIFAAYPALFVGSDAVFNAVEVSTVSGYKQTIQIDLSADVCN